MNLEFHLVYVGSNKGKPCSCETDKLILSKLAATSSHRLCVHLKCTNCTAARRGGRRSVHSLISPHSRSHRFLFVQCIRLEIHSVNSRFHIQTKHWTDPLISVGYRWARIKLGTLRRFRSNIVVWDLLILFSV